MNVLNISKYELQCAVKKPGVGLSYTPGYSLGLRLEARAGSALGDIKFTQGEFTENTVCACALLMY